MLLLLKIILIPVCLWLLTFVLSFIERIFFIEVLYKVDRYACIRYSFTGMGMGNCS